MEESADFPWLREPVRLKLHSGSCRYLLSVRRERCCECTTGTRITSVWVCGRGRGEVVSWCAHCFNATCESHSLSDDEKRHFKLIRSALSEGTEPRVWPAVRPALEDLARRGLIR